MRQAGLSLLVGIGIGLTAAFLLVAHDRSQRAVEALGQAYEASRPTGTPVVQAVPIENPPPVSPGSAAQGGAPQTAQNPDQNAVQPLASSQAPTDTPLALGGSPGGTSRAASGEGTSRALPFLGVRCENGYVVETWPGGPFSLTWPEEVSPPDVGPLTITPDHPMLLGAVVLGNVPKEAACYALKRDVLSFKPGALIKVRLSPDGHSILSYRVVLQKRPPEADPSWF